MEKGLHLKSVKIDLVKSCLKGF